MLNNYLHECYFHWTIFVFFYYLETTFFSTVSYISGKNNKYWIWRVSHDTVKLHFGQLLLFNQVSTWALNVRLFK